MIRVNHDSQQAVDGVINTLIETTNNDEHAR